MTSVPFVLVTGCASFIGSHVTERLLQAGQAVCRVDNFDGFYAWGAKEHSVAHESGTPFAFVENDCGTLHHVGASYEDAL